MKLPLACFLCLVAANLARAAAAATPEIAALIQQAGDADSDDTRGDLLDRIAASPGLDVALKAEAEALATLAHKWNHSGLTFYTGVLKNRTDLGKDRNKVWLNYPSGVAADSPLQPLTDLYKGRMIAWNLIESSTVRGSEDLKHWSKDEATKLFAAYAKAYPKNGIAKMYLGQPIPWPVTEPSAPGAPEWAVLQRESLDRLRQIILWWIEHRQDKSGYYGGGRGDDCEMWRWWSSLLLGFDEPKIRDAQLKMSKSALKGELTEHGYNTEITDVEHTAEDTSDSLIPLMLLEPAATQWVDGARKLPRLMMDVWTGRNERGQLQFKSFYFSATGVSPSPGRAYDVMADIGALNPAFVAWQRTGDAEIGKPLLDWLATWVDATAREEAGKPAGVLPAALQWPSGSVRTEAGNWWEPVKPGGYMYTYYLWPGILTEMTDALALANAMSGDSKYLNPLRSMAALRLADLKSKPADAAAPGTPAWISLQLAPRQNANSSGSGLAKSLARARALTGTAEFDEVLALESGEFVVRDDAKGVADLTAALTKSLEAMRQNFAGFTSEVRATDRVLRFVQFLAKDYDFDGYGGVTLPKHELLYRMVTGDQDAPRTPNPAVHWNTPSADLAVLVGKVRPQEFEAELYHFGAEPRAMSAEMWSLRPGAYTVQLMSNGQPEGAASELKIEKSKPGRVSFTLPSKKLCKLKISPK